MNSYVNEDSSRIRLQKVMASAGVASRRASEGLIVQGRVSVNDETVRELGTRVDPAIDIIRVDGTRIVTNQDHLTVIFHKPAGVVSTMSDPEGRPDLNEYVAEFGKRLFHVGRLDTDTEGLLLLTNDGELANRLAHPSSEIPKVYQATVKGIVPRGLGRKLSSGVTLEDGLVAVDGFVLKDVHAGLSLVEITLHEGRNRVVRRLMEAVGYPVVRLVRTGYGSLSLGNLRPGRARRIGGQELSNLMKMVQM